MTPHPVDRQVPQPGPSLAMPVLDARMETRLRSRMAEVEARLEEEGVVIRDLPGTGWLRASCGFWTSDDDLRRLVAALSG